MPAMLEECRNHLQKVYREKLGIEFADSLGQLEAGRQPVWRLVSAEDLTTDVGPDAEAVGALLDPEIGLLFYLVPFHSTADLRRQISCAAALGTRLSIRTAGAARGTEGGDRRGAWRVVMTWLVEDSERQAWIEQVAAVRQERPFSEDVSLDAIFLNPGDDLGSQLRRHGFPRLLLSTREVFAKHRIEEVLRWMSADDLVRDAFSGFESRFERPERRELAEGIIRTVEGFAAASENSTNVVKLQDRQARLRRLERIRVRGFRNLGAVDLDFGPGPVSVTVVHGPNGTGKTSLCEAISLALFGSSSAYRSFSDRTREKDISSTDRAREYLARYLTPLQPCSELPEDADPRIALNDAPLLSPALLPATDACTADMAMSGTILHQDTSLEFAKMSAQELGARILRGYSGLADHIEEYADSRMLEANTNRQDFLRTLGLPASITKLDTAFGRMARRELDRSLPAFPRPLVEWLDSIGPGEGLARRWQEWGNESGRNALAGRLSLMDRSPSNLEFELRSWLEEFNALVTLSAEAVKNIDSRIGPHRPELDQVASRIDTWGLWLEAGGADRAVLSTERPGSEPEALARQLEELQAEQLRILEQGRNAARHHDHLTQVEAYVREAWGRQHADECPTCGVSHADHGGILPVIESLREQAAAERDGLRARYGSLRIQIDETQKRLAGSGRTQCPIPAGEQSRMVEALRWLIPGPADFREWIAAKARRESLLAVLGTLKHMPAVPPTIDVVSEAARVTGELIRQFADARQVFDAPSNWKPVKEKLNAILADIVNQHLPRTLGAVWSEICLNLTPAPWLLPESPSIDVTSKRGEQRSALQVRGRLARYILNHSEVHVLGLGWFFTRYLTCGRFAYPCMVMDDPAHELDQVSFRDLCRFWETLVRLHRVYDRPFQLVVTLNQESRAMEAARSTGGILRVLGWTPNQTRPLHTACLIPDDAYAPQPAALFQKLA